LNVWVFWLSSLVMLGEVGERKKEQTWDAEEERTGWACWVNSFVAPSTPIYLIFYNFIWT
jgi:hypothetical protein